MTRVSKCDFALVNVVCDKSCLLLEVISKGFYACHGYNVTSRCFRALARINSSMRGFCLIRTTEAIVLPKRK
jgi:hypothetical protein